MLGLMCSDPADFITSLASGATYIRLVQPDEHVTHISSTNVGGRLGRHIQKQLTCHHFSSWLLKLKSIRTHPQIRQILPLCRLESSCSGLKLKVSVTFLFTISMYVWNQIRLCKSSYFSSGYLCYFQSSIFIQLFTFSFLTIILVNFTSLILVQLKVVVFIFEKKIHWELTEPGMCINLPTSKLPYRECFNLTCWNFVWNICRYITKASR